LHFSGEMAPQWLAEREGIVIVRQIPGEPASFGGIDIASDGYLILR
jgi:hypothetical protein